MRITLAGTGAAVVGTFDRWAEGSLLVVGEADTSAVPSSVMARLERLEGTRSRFGVLGAAVGLVVGGVIAWRGKQADASGSCVEAVGCWFVGSTEISELFVVTTLGATGGAIAGFLFGSVFRTEHWVAVPMIVAEPGEDGQPTVRISMRVAPFLGGR